MFPRNNVIHKTMTKEELAKHYCTRYENDFLEIVSNEDGLLSDLNSLLRDELIKFCRAKIPSEWIGDEIILVDQYLNEQR